MDELKPCPFCGTTPKAREHDFGGEYRTWIVECSDSDCPALRVRAEDLSEADAITAWNTPAASGGDSASLEQRAWMFYFTDDAYTPFAYVCYGRGGLEQGVIAWLGEDAIADSGERMAPAIAEALIDTGEFHAEDGACYAKPISSAVPAGEQWTPESVTWLGVGRVGLRQEQAPFGVAAHGFESVPPLADGAHEVQPEAIEAGLRLVGSELGLAADANPHAASIHPAGAVEGREQRARELLAAEYERNEQFGAAEDIRAGHKVGRDSDVALRAITAALANQQGVGDG